MRGSAERACVCVREGERGGELSSDRHVGLEYVNQSDISSSITRSQSQSLLLLLLLLFQPCHHNHHHLLVFFSLDFFPFSSIALAYTYMYLSPT